MIFQSLNISRGILYALWLLSDPLIRKAIKNKYGLVIRAFDFT